MDLVVELHELADETRLIDRSFSARLEQLADSLQKPENASVDLYGSFSLDTLEERAFSDYQVRPRWLLKYLGAFEWIRNILVLIPIAITWLALWQASLNYNALIAEKPELITQPFLLLWEQGFEELESASGSTFSQVAFVDFSLLFTVVVLTVVIHFYKDTRESGARKNSTALRCRIEDVLWRANLQLAETRHNQTPAIAFFKFQDVADQLVDQLKQERDRLNQLVADEQQKTDEITILAQNLTNTTTDLRQFSQDIQKTYTPLNGSIQTLVNHVATSGQQQGQLVIALDTLNSQMNNLIEDIHHTTTELTDSVVRISDYTGMTTGVFTTIQQSMEDMVQRTDVVSNNLRDATGNMRDSSQEIQKILSSLGSLEDNLVMPLQMFAHEMDQFSRQVPGIAFELQQSGQSLQTASASLVDSANQMSSVTQASAQSLQNTEAMLNQTAKKLQNIITNLQDATENAERFSLNINNTMSIIGDSMQDLAPTLQGLTKLIQSGGTLRFGKVERSLIAFVLLMLTGSCGFLAILVLTTLGFIAPG